MANMVVRNMFMYRTLRAPEVILCSSIVLPHLLRLWFMTTIDMVSRTAYILLCHLSRETKFMGRAKPLRKPPSRSKYP